MPFGFGHGSGDCKLAEHGQRAPAEVLSSEPTKRFESSGDYLRTAIDPALELATVRHSHSQVRAEVTLPDGRRAIADAQAAPPEHRAELERFAGFYAKGAMSDDEFRELRRRILGLPEPAVVRVAVLGDDSRRLVVSVTDASGLGSGATVAPALDPLDEIARLARLRDSGALSHEEFDARKRALLDSA